MSLYNELKRRNVIRVAIAYTVTAWLVIQVVETIFPAFGFSDATVRFVVIAFAIGLLAAIRDNVHRYHSAGISRANLFYSADYEEGLVTYLSGGHKKGLALIAKGAKDGYFILPGEAYLQVLYDDPGFAPIRAAQEARQARERQKLLNVVCKDNPYVAVWQPAEGTCDQFAETGMQTP